MTQPDLSIIVLAYQEEKRIGDTLDKLADFLKQHKLGDVEVLLVAARPDNGKPADRTLAIGKEKDSLFDNLRVVDAGPRAGKGRDARFGMFEATGKIRLFMDADLATPLHHLLEVKQLTDEGAKVVIGVRDLTSSHTGLRKFISSFGNLLVQAILLPGVIDTQCGFKAFEAEAAEKIFGRMTILGWGFDMEVLAIAKKLGYEIKTIMIDDWQDVAGGTFSNVAVTGALSTLRDLFSIKWKSLSGRYAKSSYHHQKVAQKQS